MNVPLFILHICVIKLINVKPSNGLISMFWMNIVSSTFRIQSNRFSLLLISCLDKTMTFPHRINDGLFTILVPHESFVVHSNNYNLERRSKLPNFSEIFCEITYRSVSWCRSVCCKVESIEIDSCVCQLVIVSMFRNIQRSFEDFAMIFRLGHNDKFTMFSVNQDGFAVSSVVRVFVMITSPPQSSWNCHLLVRMDSWFLDFVQDDFVPMWWIGTVANISNKDAHFTWTTNTSCLRRAIKEYFCKSTYPFVQGAVAMASQSTLAAPSKQCLAKVLPCSLIA